MKIKIDKTGILYLSLHNQLVKKYGFNTIITRKELFEKLGRHFMVPKEERDAVIIEMCFLELLERVNRDSLKILPTHNNLIERRLENGN